MVFDSRQTGIKRDLIRTIKSRLTFQNLTGIFCTHDVAESQLLMNPSEPILEVRSDNGNLIPFLLDGANQTDNP